MDIQYQSHSLRWLANNNQVTKEYKQDKKNNSSLFTTVSVFGYHSLQWSAKWVYSNRNGIIFNIQLEINIEKLCSDFGFKSKLMIVFKSSFDS